MRFIQDNGHYQCLRITGDLHLLEQNLAVRDLSSTQTWLRIGKLRTANIHNNCVLHKMYILHLTMRNVFIKENYLLNSLGY